MRRYSFHLALVALILVALPASSATLTWYTDRAAWETAVGNTFSLINFSEVSAGNYGTQAGVTIQDVWFQAYNETGAWYLFVSDNDYPNQNLYATGNSTSNPPAAYTRAKFYQDGDPYKAYKAVGVDVSTTSQFFYVKEDGVGQWVQTGNTGFVGFVSDVAVSQVWFASRTGIPGAAGYYNLDNFVFSNGSEPPVNPEETPDLGTLILCGTGLSILSFVMRLRKRRVKA